MEVCGLDKRKIRSVLFTRPCGGCEVGIIGWQTKGESAIESMCKTKPVR